jgi:hypothetical protein
MIETKALADMVLSFQQLSSEEDYAQPQLVPTVSSVSNYHTCLQN